MSALIQTTRYFLVFTFILFLSACGEQNDNGHFELQVLSSVFHDISIEQGKTGMTVVSIDRFVDPDKFLPTIEMSLLNPADWLIYRFENNPVKGDNSILVIEVDKDAVPGIYRIVLQGVAKINNTTITDSATFHLVVNRTSPVYGVNPNKTVTKAVTKVPPAREELSTFALLH